MNRFAKLALLFSAIATTVTGVRRWIAKRARKALYGIETYDQVRRLEMRTTRYIVANIVNPNVSAAEFHRTLSEMNREIEELLKEK